MSPERTASRTIEQAPHASPVRSVRDINLWCNGGASWSAIQDVRGAEAYRRPPSHALDELDEVGVQRAEVREEVG